LQVNLISYIDELYKYNIKYPFSGTENPFVKGKV
jgi:hypothetical protein